jgi:predicted molibdopterin-dependent oxidoreductase YjgC
MPDPVRLTLNGKSVAVPAGTVVAAALAQLGEDRFRRSATGAARGPLCGMGTCFECRVTINGQPHQRSCQTLCADGMEVRTDE